MMFDALTHLSEFFRNRLKLYCAIFLSKNLLLQTFGIMGLKSDGASSFAAIKKSYDTFRPKRAVQKYWKRILLFLCLALYVVVVFGNTKRANRTNITLSFHDSFNIDYSVKYSSYRHAIHKPAEALFTFVIPSFKQLRVLKKCLNSILHQHWPSSLQNHLKKDMQIIVVFDEPRSKKIETFCKEYVRKSLSVYPQKIEFLIVFKENGGVADARNVGLRLSTGKWITTVDADDMVLSTFFTNFERLSIQNSITNRSISSALDHISVIAPALLFKNGVWENRDIRSTDVLIDNFFHCSVLVNRNVFLQIGGTGRYLQWWQDPYLFFGWEDWNFWMHTKKFIDHVLYVKEPWVYYSSGQRHLFCMKYRDYCLALMRISNSPFFDPQTILDDMYAVARSQEGDQFRRHSRWKASLSRYGKSFSVPLVWASLFALRGNNTMQAIDYVAKMRNRTDRSSAYLLKVYESFLHGHLIQNASRGFQDNELLKDLLKVSTKPKSKIVFTVPLGTRQQDVLKLLKKIPRIYIPNASKRVSILVERLTTKESIHVDLVEVDIKTTEVRRRDSLIKLNNYSSLFPELLSSRLGFVSPRMTKTLLQVDRMHMPESAIFRISQNEWDEYASSDLMIGWQSRIRIQNLPLNADVESRRNMVNRILMHPCEDIFGNTIEQDFCKGLLILYDATEYSAESIIEAATSLSNFVPRDGVFFGLCESKRNMSTPLTKFRTLLHEFVRKGCISENTLRSGSRISPSESTLLWWTSRLLIEQPCVSTFGKTKPRVNRKQAIYNFVSKNSWQKTETCAKTFITDSRHDDSIHMIISTNFSQSSMNYSISSVASAMASHPNLHLKIHTDYPEVRVAVEDGIKPGWTKKMAFSPMCASYLCGLHSSFFIQEFMYRYASRKYFGRHVEDVYKYIVLYHLGGMYADNSIIFLRNTQKLDNFLVRESPTSLTGAVMRFHRWHKLLEAVLLNLEYVYEPNEPDGAGTQLVLQHLSNMDYPVRILRTASFYPLPLSNFTARALTPVSRSEFKKMRKCSHGIYVLKNKKRVTRNEDKRNRWSVLGRLSQCPGFLPVVVTCPILE